MKPPDREFISESEEILEDAVNLLLGIQESPEGQANPDSINALFRGMHTIKGMAGLYGYQGLSDLSHALESILDNIRLGRAELSGDVTGFLFESVDLLKSLLRDAGSGAAEKDTDVSEHVSRIDGFRKSLRGADKTQPLEGIIDGEIIRTLSEYEEHRLKVSLKEGRGVYSLRQVLPFDDFDTRLREVAARVKKLGELISTMPVSEGVPDGSMGFELILGSSLSAAGVRKALGMEVRELVRRKNKSASSGPAEVAEAKQEKASSSTLRVDISKIDRVLNTIGELSVMKNTLRGLWTEMSETYGHGPLMLGLYRVVQGLERENERLQQQVLDIRMVPVDQIFRKLAQVVRRYSKSLGKKMQLLTFGEDTEIDKHLAEELIDPLMHIVRNAVDHGIEPAKERRAVGKKISGSIEIKAFQRGNNVVVEVRDDGKGLDREEITRKAAEKGIINIKKCSDIEDREIYDLLFSPGFSTRDTVSEVSGRGVGLDIVKEKLSALGGTVEVWSELGSGTAFMLTLPITLAIVKALLVRTGGEKFAVPLSSIFETVDVEHGDIIKAEDRKIYRLRDEELPVASLADLFRLPGGAAEKSFAVVAGHGARRICLLVDELIGRSEVVIKSLGGYLEGVKGIGGAAEIGKDDVVLVLDVESIVEETLAGEGVSHV